MKRSTKPKNNLSLLLIVSVIIQCCLIPGCKPVPLAGSEITRSGFYFDTLINISIYDSTDTSLLDSCFDMCGYYENMLSATVSGSDIYRINEAGTEPVQVSRTTADLIDASIRFCEESDGMLDITLKPLSDMWTDARTLQSLPDPDSISTSLEHTGTDMISVDKENCTVTKKDALLMIDLGAFAKGYIADRLKEILISNNVHSAIISLGGNILTIGNRPGNSPFRIAVKHPFSENNEAAAVLKINDMSVVTSGVYERYFVYEDKIYHHILNPGTGYPADSDLLSATVISASSFDGDALSTLCLLYGLDKATRLIDNTPGVEAVFITKDNTLHYTGGAEKYL